MSVPQASWLLEPHVRHFFIDFPMPLALLRQDGGIVALNTRFTESIDIASLESDAVQRLVRSPGAEWAPVSLVGRGGGGVPARARALRAEDNVLLVLSSPSLEDAEDPEVGQLRQRLSQLEQLVATDRLTGVWNRSHFDRMIELELGRSSRYQQPLSLILLDIDHFKQVNDRFGHAAGDSVLCELVRVVQQRIRGADSLFRWGGEEFVVMTPSTGYRSAAVAAEKIRAAVESHDFPDAGKVTISLGVAECLPHEGAGDCFKRVDASLYAAKNAGRNRVVVDRCGSSDVWAQAGNRSVIKLQWNEAYECGEATIDAQHRRLFELANKLIECAFDTKQDRPALNVLFEELLHHVALHFADEEAILESKRYERLEAHKRAHAGLLSRAARLQQKAAAGDITLGELVEFLAHDVVARHLLTADREFFPLFSVPVAAASAS
jgi:diguanylate cyclase (GGDEF)-like protein/hemerythrin-like metal-binding protein